MSRLGCRELIELLKSTSESEASRFAATEVDFGATLPAVENARFASIRRVTDIPWSDWTPTERATLVFVQRPGEILLIRKKRGLGAGKINGPGGRMEPGESATECAVREAQEELGITPSELSCRGELNFQFVDGYGLSALVFSAAAFSGEPIETDEAMPRWTALGAIPYDEMWEDDALWFPPFLAGRCFRGRFIFDGDAMLDHSLNVWGHAAVEFQPGSASRCSDPADS